MLLVTGGIRRPAVRELVSGGQRFLDDPPAAATASGGQVLPTEVQKLRTGGGGVRGFLHYRPLQKYNQLNGFILLNI